MKIERQDRGVREIDRPPADGRWSFWRLATLMVLMLMLASSPAVAQTFELEPASFGLVTTRIDSGPRGAACGVDRRGAQSTFAAAFSLPVGFDNAQWGKRKRCKRSSIRHFTSHVNFDLRDLPPDPRIESARLRFEALTPRGAQVPTGAVPASEEFADTLRDGEGEETFVALEENCRPRQRGEEPLWESYQVPERYRGIAAVVVHPTAVTGRTTREPSRQAPFPRRSPDSTQLPDTFEFERGVASVDVTEWLKDHLNRSAPTLPLALIGYYRDEKTNDSCASAVSPQSVRLEITF